MVTLLVVDDAAHVRRMIRFAMQGLGYRVIEARDGSEALRLLASATPDLVITDVMMPGLSGLDVCRAIRGDPTVAGLPVIVLTAGMDVSATDALAAGASAFMTKPFSPVALRALVASLVD